MPSSSRIRPREMAVCMSMIFILTIGLNVYVHAALLQPTSLRECSPVGGFCLIRTPFYTGPDFPCCDSNDECVFPNPKVIRGVCTSKMCSATGGTCRTRTPIYTGPELPCCDISDECVFPNPDDINGVCTSKTCSPTGGTCRTRTLIFTGPSFPCCDSTEKCVFDDPKSINGRCVANIDTCLPSSSTCQDGGGSPCCPSLSCQIVVTGAPPPIGQERRICFDSNCGRGECSEKNPCCPGMFCGSFRGRSVCLAPP